MALGVPVVNAQGRLHPLQWLRSVARLTSQSDPLPSQFSLFPRHSPIAHDPPEQSGVASVSPPHDKPQPPQSARVSSGFSQASPSPSQSSQPSAHVSTTHFRATQADSAAWSRAHSLPQAPQCATESSEPSHPFAAAPSQSRKPLSQLVITQLPRWHSAVACGASQPTLAAGRSSIRRSQSSSSSLHRSGQIFGHTWSFVSGFGRQPDPPSPASPPPASPAASARAGDPSAPASAACAPASGAAPSEPALPASA